MNQPAVQTNFCANCGGRLIKTVKLKYSLLDLFGVVVVGSFVFGLLALFVSSSHVGRAFVFIIWVGGLVALGLYHMIGFKQTEKTKCSQCGEIHEEDILA